MSHGVLKAFLSRCSPEKQRALGKFLPEREQKELFENSSSFDPSCLANPFALERVHWSWFLPTLKAYPENDQKLFLSALSPTSAKNLAKTLTLSSYLQDISELAKSYLRKVLLDSLIGPEEFLLPPDCVGDGPLKKLLESSKKELTKLIDFLSLYDLAAEQRLIVETKMLKKIYSLLSDDERKFLKHALAVKEPFFIARMGLDRWDGSEEALRTLLHKRGLARFAAGLSGQEPGLIWYVCHALDIGRGTALFKQCAKEKIQDVTDRVVKQIEELLVLL